MVERGVAAISLVYALDGDPLTTESLKRMLGQETDLEVATFGQAAELRVRAGARPPDAVIAEVGAPGIDLIEEMQEADPDLAWLVVAAQSDPDAYGAALGRVGPLRLAHKPFDPRDLLPKLRAALDERALRRELAGARAILEQQRQALSASRAQVERTAAELEHTSSELATATERLVEAEQLAAVARVLSGISHEITSQLALVGYAEALRSRVARDDELVELCDVIISAQKRLVAMVDQVREFVTEPRRTGARLRREPADVVAVVDEALGILRYDRDLRARNLVKNYRARPLCALHREKFSQVVINLVSNAVQATSPGDSIEVELDRDPSAGELLLRVSDRGIGMAPAVVARLGEPFFTTRGDRGSGLGVGICMQIVAEHGGALTFTSEEGVGTEALVRLPLIEGGTEGR
jgi:signal transduction histidine kinase